MTNDSLPVTASKVSDRKQRCAVLGASRRSLTLRVEPSSNNTPDSERNALDSESQATADAEFLIEAISMRPEFECIAVPGPFAAAANSLHDIDWVIVASPFEQRATDAIAALKAGFNVVVMAPVAASSLDVQSLVSAALDAQKCCRVWMEPRDDFQFTQALECVQSGQIGDLRTLSFTLRQTMDFLLPQNHQARPNVSLIDAFGWRYFDQLFELVNRPAKRIFGYINRGELCFDSLATCGEKTSDEVGFLAIIEFENNCVAQIEIDLASSTTVAPQWRLQGARGGYANGKQSLLESDGEIYEIDTAAPILDPLAVLQTPDPMTGSDAVALTRMLTVTRWIEALRESAARHAVVEL